MTDILTSVVELLTGEGEPVQGFEGDFHHAEAYAILHYASRPYCLVKDWIIVEVSVTDDMRKSLAADGLEPYVLYASNVVIHSTGKRNAGDWVRSTFQRPVNPDHIFQTRNTTYVLMGPGQRKRASAQTLLAIVN